MLKKTRNVLNRLKKRASLFVYTEGNICLKFLFSEAHSFSKKIKVFIYFFKACEENNISFKLPEGSRICDGGGYLGQFGECTKDEYFEKCEKVLGVEERFCVNVLGMGESSTNYFDNVFRNSIITRKEVPRGKEIPPWTRTTVVDTKEFKSVPKGEIGLLRHYDLVNRAMVFAAQGYESAPD